MSIAQVKITLPRQAESSGKMPRLNFLRPIVYPEWRFCCLLSIGTGSAFLLAIASDRDIL